MSVNILTVGATMTLGRLATHEPKSPTKQIAERESPAAK